MTTEAKEVRASEQKGDVPAPDEDKVVQVWLKISVPQEIRRRARMLSARSDRSMQSIFEEAITTGLEIQEAAFDDEEEQRLDAEARS